MSKVTNENFVAGDTISSSDVDDKFNDINTATDGVLDENNVTRECIDIQHPETGLFIKNVSHSIDTNSDAHTSGQGTVEIKAGTLKCRFDFTPNGLELEAGDLLRVHWTLFVSSQAIGFNGYTKAGFAATHDTAGACWLAWLQWDDTDNTLTNWEAVDGQEDPTRAAGVNTMNCDNTEATTPIPLCVVYYDAGGDEVLEYARAALGDRFQVRGSYNYRHSGATRTIYGLRLVLDGVWRGAYSAPNSLFLYNDGDAWNTDGDIDLTLTATQFSYILMRDS